MNSAEVKCRHCGEVIEKCSDDCPSGGYTRVSDGSHYCNGRGDLTHTVVDRTVLSAEDRERLEESHEYLDSIVAAGLDNALHVVSARNLINAVLANAGYAE